MNIATPYNRLEDYLKPLDILEKRPYFKTIVMQKDSEFTELFNYFILKMQARPLVIYLGLPNPLVGFI